MPLKSQLSNILCLRFTKLMATRSCAYQRKVLLLTADFARLIMRQKTPVALLEIRLVLDTGNV